MLHFSCPSWRNAAGKHIVVKSICQYGHYNRTKLDANGEAMTHPNGSVQLEFFTGAHWADTRPFPPGNLSTYPAELNRPGGRREQYKSFKLL